MTHCTPAGTGTEVLAYFTPSIYRKVFHMCWASQRAGPNAYRLMHSPSPERAAVPSWHNRAGGACTVASGALACDGGARLAAAAPGPLAAARSRWAARRLPLQPWHTSGAHRAPGAWAGAPSRRPAAPAPRRPPGPVGGAERAPASAAACPASEAATGRGRPATQARGSGRGACLGALGHGACHGSLGRWGRARRGGASRHALPLGGPLALIHPASRADQHL